MKTGLKIVSSWPNPLIYLIFRAGNNFGYFPATLMCGDQGVRQKDKTDPLIFVQIEPTA
jgi:hypothetical protein